MIKIVYGPAGSGKSTYIYENIIKDLKSGNRPMLIVPDQNVLSAERSIASLADGISTADLEVLSFRRLSNFVFRSLGGLSFNDIDESGRLLVMWRVLREASAFLKVYERADEKSTSFAELMLSTVNELKQFSVTPSMLESAADKLQDKHKILSDKLRDIGFIYSTYQAFLSKEYNDPTDELTRLANTLENSNFFQGYTVYFDAFDTFTPQQYSVIRHIAYTADETIFSLCYDDTDKSGVFSTTEFSFKGIKKLADRLKKDVEYVFLGESKSFESPAIAYVSKNLWHHEVNANAYEGNSDEVVTISCHDKFEECEAVVCDILKKIRSGVRYSDVLIIARDISSYEGIIDSELENNGLPFFMSRRTDITSKPIFKLILAALAIKNKGWRFNDVISYVKTGLCGISYDECDVLENYASAWNISGKRWYDGIEWNMNPDGFTELFTPEGEETVRRANEIREKIVPPLVRFFDSFNGATVADVTRGLYQLLTELNVREQIEQKASECRSNNQLAEEKELVQLWNLLINALDSIVDLVGDVKADGRVFGIILDIVLSKIDIGTIPPGVDQIMLGSASTLRSGSVPYVYLLGVNDGVFPKTAAENCIFSDNEKSILKSVDVEISPGTDKQTGDELYWFYRAVSTAEKGLTLTYSSSDLKGAANTISVAGSRVNFLLGDKKYLKYCDVPAIEKIEGKNIALKALALNRDNELGMALTRYFANDADAKSRVDAFDEPLEAGISDIEEDLAMDVYKGDMITSQSKIDSYVKCSFSYHCDYVLGLKEKKSASFRSNDIGNFVHVVLERFMARIATPEGIDTSLSESEILSLIDEIIDEYVITACQGIPQNSPRLLQMIKRLRTRTVVLIKSILREFKQSDFVPSFFELPISFKDENGIEPYEISLDDGTKICLIGKVDRVDTYKKGKDVYVRIIDYKTGSKTFSLSDVEKGLNLQMLLYLFAIWNTKSKSFKDRIKCEGDILPAGILYFSAKSPDFYINNEDDIKNAGELAQSNVDRFGLLINDMDILRAMEKNLERQYIPAGYGSNNRFFGENNLKTVEEFGEISKQIEGILRKIATEMKSGCVNAKPLEVSNPDESPCVYCKMKPICRRVGKEEADE